MAFRSSAGSCRSARRTRARAPRRVQPWRVHRLSRLAQLFDSLLERQAERFVSSRPVFCAAPRECNQCSGEAFAVVEAGGPVAVGGEYEEVFTVKDSVEPELAEPSQFLVGDSYEHLGFEGHAVT